MVVITHCVIPRYSPDSVHMPPHFVNTFVVIIPLAVLQARSVQQLILGSVVLDYGALLTFPRIPPNNSRKDTPHSTFQTSLQ